MNAMKDWSKGGVEPSVNEVLSDPIVHLVMQRDGVALDDLKTLVHAARVGLPGVAPAGELPLSIADPATGG